MRSSTSFSNNHNHIHRNNICVDHMSRIRNIMDLSCLVSWFSSCTWQDCDRHLNCHSPRGFLSDRLKIRAPSCVCVDKSLVSVHLFGPSLKLSKHLVFLWPRHVTGHSSNVSYILLSQSLLFYHLESSFAVRLCVSTNADSSMSRRTSTNAEKNWIGRAVDNCVVS